MLEEMLSKIERLPNVKISAKVNPIVRGFLEILDREYARKIYLFPGADRANIRRWRQGRDPKVGSLLQALSVMGYTLKIVKADEP